LLEVGPVEIQLAREMLARCLHRSKRWVEHVIVVGSEGKGLSRLVSETCDQIVSIPMSSAVESLNAGIATGVTLYEVARRRAL